MSVLLMAAVPASADQFDTVNYLANVGVNFDDNIYRLPAGYDPQVYLGKASKSDTIKSASLGINLDKKYSNQELVLNAVGTVSKYSNFTSLDYTSSSLKGAWNWQITPRFSGSLNANHTQTLSNPADTKVFARNLVTSNNLGLDGDWWVDSRWHLLFSTSSGRVSYSTNITNFQSSDSRANELGMKYDLADGSSLSLFSRDSNQTTNPVASTDSSSSDKQTGLRATWQLSGKSVLSGNLMNAKRQYVHYAQRDFSGVQGGLNYALDISGKSFVNLSWQRNLNSWWDAASSYYVADTFAISPSWQISSKSTLRMTLSHGSNDYRGPVGVGAIARQDVTQSVRLGWDWTPQRALTISATVQHDKRSSTPALYSGFGFDENSAAVTVQAYF